MIIRFAPFLSSYIIATFTLMRFTEANRFKKTRSFVQKHIESGTEILDLGTPNDLSKFIASSGYTVHNTKGENLDTDFPALFRYGCGLHYCL